jgi:hypothetical protein
MSAALLTLLFILFPPNAKPTNLVRQAFDGSTYVSQLPPEPVATPAVVAPPVAAIRPANPVTSSPAAAVAATPQPQSTVANPPQSAHLSLALPGDKDPNQETTGLDHALTGRLYNGSIKANGFKIPLLEGEWALLGAGKIDSPTSTGSAYFLGRIEKKRLTGAIIVHALRTKPGITDLFPGFLACGLSQTLFSVVDANDPKDRQACWIIHNIFTPPWQQWADKELKLSNLIRAAGGDMAAKGITYPQDFLEVEFVQNEKWGGLSIGYLFNPETVGIQSSDAISVQESDWAANNLNRTPAKLAYVDGLKKWAASVWPSLQTSFVQSQ